MLRAGKHSFQSCPYSVGGEALFTGDASAPFVKGGGAHADLLRAVPVLPRGHRHSWPGHPGTQQKEVTALSSPARRLLL